MKQDYGDAPIQQEYKKQMLDIAKALDEVFNGGTKGDSRKTGFILLVFPFGSGDDHRCNYISNGVSREDVVALFKEQIARFEGRYREENS